MKDLTIGGAVSTDLEDLAEALNITEWSTVTHLNIK
jgi:hypothetical protein